MAQTIAVLSQKGGTGKTTAVRTLTDVLRRAGLSVLAIDLDPQGNLSDYFDLEPDVEPTIGDVLVGRAEAGDAIHDDVIPANLTLAESELVLAGKMGRELTLRRALAGVGERLRPDPDRLPAGARPADRQRVGRGRLGAAVSAEAQYFALQGVEQATQVIELAQGLNPDLKWMGVVLNIADMRTTHSREAFASLRESYGDKLFSTPIRQSIAYAESAERGVSILDRRPDLGVDYVQLAMEMLARLGDHGDAAPGAGRRDAGDGIEASELPGDRAQRLERRHRRRPPSRPSTRTGRGRRSRSPRHGSTAPPSARRRRSSRRARRARAPPARSSIERG